MKTRIVFIIFMVICFSNKMFSQNDTIPKIDQEKLAIGIFGVFYRANILEKFQKELFKKKYDSINYVNEGNLSYVYTDRILKYDENKLKIFKFSFSQNSRLIDYTFYYNYSIFAPITIVFNPLNRFYILELNQKGNYEKLYKYEIDRRNKEDFEFFSKLLIYYQTNPEEDLEFILIDSTNYSTYKKEYKEIELPKFDINEVNTKIFYYSIEPEIGRVILYRIILDEDGYKFLKTTLRQDTWITH